MEQEFEKAVEKVQVGEIISIPSPIALPGFEKMDLQMTAHDPATFECYVHGIRIGRLRKWPDKWRFTS